MLARHGTLIRCHCKRTNNKCRCPRIWSSSLLPPNSPNEKCPEPQWVFSGFVHLAITSQDLHNEPLKLGCFWLCCNNQLSQVGNEKINWIHWSLPKVAIGKCVGWWFIQQVCLCVCVCGLLLLSMRLRERVWGRWLVWQKEFKACEKCIGKSD